MSYGTTAAERLLADQRRMAPPHRGATWGVDWWLGKANVVGGCQETRTLMLSNGSEVSLDAMNKKLLTGEIVP